MDEWFTNVNDIIVGGNAEDQNGFAGTKIILTNFSNGTQLELIPGQENWSFAGLELVPNASNQIQAFLYRLTGNIVSSEILTVINDVTPPEISITNPATCPIVVTSDFYNITGTASDNFTGIERIESYNNGVFEAFIYSNGYNVALDFGSNRITVVAVDYSGNTNSDSCLILREGIANIEITAPTDFDIFLTNKTSVIIAGIATEWISKY